MDTNPNLEILTARTVNFPQHLVYIAWSNPDHLKNWWGPKGFTNTFHEFDFRVGGKWILTMHGPEKGNYENEAEFTDIRPPSLIAWKRHSKPLFRVVAAFEEITANTTKITFRMLFDTEEERNKLIAFVPEKNEENLDKLEVELAKMALE